MIKLTQLKPYTGRFAALAAASFLAFCTGSLVPDVMAATATSSPPQIGISSVPLQLVIPAHPQVLIAVGNSQSMDGNLSGAIMTGSGTVSDPALQASSSPVNYTVPAGFTAPLTGTTAGNSAPFVANNSSGQRSDNSDSRMNIAKASIQQILQTYSGNTDFGLMDYATSSVNLYDTWVYFMSNPGGFTFSSTVPSSGNYVANPCYNSTSTDCANIQNYYANTAVTTDPYLIVADSSDEPQIDDVLYAGSGLPDTFISYNGPHPASPYPPNFSLADYNAGNVILTYKQGVNVNQFATGPTNAGFVPASDEVFYARRGFAYFGNVSATTGKLLVPITSAGQHPTQADINNYIATFTPFLAAETNSISSSEIKASAVQSPIGGLVQAAYNYFTGSSAPTASNGCNANRYVVLMTDGLPTMDLSGNNWPPLGSSAAAGYGVTASFNANGTLATTNDQALTDTINQIANLFSKGIKTYVIGLGAGVDPTKNPQAAATLKAMAMAGGTLNYFPATNPASVASSLQVILTQIQAANLSTSAAAVNSTGLVTSTVVYQAQFSSQDIFGDWTGNLSAFPVSSAGKVTTGPSAALWQSQSVLDGQNWNTGRLIATWDPTTAAGVPFRWGTSITSTSTLGSLLMKNATDTQGPARLDYLRGDTSKEQRNGGSFRNRAHILGDIVNSDPLFIGPPRATIDDATYVTFKANHLTRQPVIYVGANDGMLHAFNATTGQELFAYVPNGVFNHLIDLTDPAYNQSHEFFTDGSPTGGDVKFADATWHTIVTGGLNDGGNSIYALDVTDPTSITSEAALSSDVLWEYTDSTLGKTYSKPQIAQIATGTTNTGAVISEWVVIFGSGYNNSDGKPYLYVVNAETGALIQKIDLCSQVSTACDLTKANGLSTPAPVSSQGAPTIDTVYAGDLQGNMWRVDLSSTLPSKWTASVLYKAQTSSGQNQPITTKPLVTFNPEHPKLSGLMVYFGTGKFLGASDITDTTQQTFYGVYDQLTGLQVSQSRLVQQTITQFSVLTANGSNLVRVLSNNPIVWSTGPSDTAGALGFYIDLPNSGERAITTPRLDNGRIIFTTFTPSTASCSAGGTSWLMVIDYATGSGFPQPEIDINGDNKIDSNDQVIDSNGNHLNPAGISMGQAYASAPTILRTRQNNINDIKLITKSTGQIESVAERGKTTQRASWRQIQ